MYTVYELLTMKRVWIVIYVLTVVRRPTYDPIFFFSHFKNHGSDWLNGESMLAGVQIFDIRRWRFGLTYECKNIYIVRALVVDRFRPNIASVYIYSGHIYNSRRTTHLVIQPTSYITLCKREIISQKMVFTICAIQVCAKTQGEYTIH